MHFSQFINKFYQTPTQLKTVINQPSSTVFDIQETLSR